MVVLANRTSGVEWLTAGEIELMCRFDDDGGRTFVLNFGPCRARGYSVSDVVEKWFRAVRELDTEPSRALHA